MTAQDAFAIAFDEFVPQEAWAMDKRTGPSTNQQNTIGKQGSKKPSGSSGGKRMGGGMGSMGGGMGDMSGKGGMPKTEQQSMSAHMQQYHPNGFNPKTDSCKLYDAMKKNLQRQGLSEEEAAAQALSAHEGSGYGGPTSESPAVSEEEGRQMAEQMCQTLLKHASLFAMEDMARKSRLIQPPVAVQMEDGTQFNAQDTFQLACAMFVLDKTENGSGLERDVAQESLSQMAEIASRNLSPDMAGQPQQQPQQPQAGMPQQTEGQPQQPQANEMGQPAQATVAGTQQPEQPNAQPESAQPQTRSISSSSGKTSRQLTAEEEQIINDFPEKEETLRSIIDVEERASNPSLNEDDRKDLRKARKQLRTQFYGRDVEEDEPQEGGETAETGSAEPRTTGKRDDYFDALDKMHDAAVEFDRTRDLEHGDETKIAAQKAFEDARAVVETFEQSNVDIVDDDGNVIDTGEDRRKWAETERTLRNAGGDSPTPPSGDGGDGTNPPNNTPNNPPNNGGDNTNVPPSPPPKPTPKPAEKPTSSASTQTSQPVQTTPSDEEFRTADGKYEVNGIKYRDLSGQGLLHGLLSAFLAGIHGEGIITGWDKISGTWDQMKRSANGENVRSGITGALLSSTIGDYANREGLSEDAKMEIDLVNEMYSQAKTPSQKMSAVKEFQKWKEKYKEELGEEKKTGESQTFDPLPNDYKGTKPPLSILGKPQGYSADTKYGEQVAEAIKGRLGELGFPLGDGEPKVHVGPSATTIEFKVPPLFNMSAAKSAKTKESLKGAIGSPVSSVGYAAGKKDVLEITITNEEMRPVFFSDVMHSKEWQDFSKKGKIPMALGKDAKGDSKFLELTDMPHMMVTGATRSGKSVFLLSALNSAEMAKTPDELRVVCIDPKEEFKSQKGSPHLLYPIPTKKRDIANVVASLRAEMEKRISMVGGSEESYDPKKNEFTGNSNRNIDGYNAAHPNEKMPHIMVVFDEVADVMKDPDVGAQVAADMDSIMALGRSVGINCILATQRHDVASLSGSIQANMPAHLMFRASQDDHKADPIAKTLAGNGDYYLKTNGEETRGRGCYITDENVAAVPAYYRDHMAGGDEPPTDDGGDEDADDVKLPQEHLDQIAAAVKKGLPVSMEAEEGFQDAFKSAFPEDWEITEEEVDGKKLWRASPPKAPADKTEKSAEPKLKEGYTSVPPPEDSEYKALIKDSEGNTVGGLHVDGSRIDFTKNGKSLKSDEKAPWELDAEKKDDDKPAKKIEKLEDLDQSFNPNQVESMMAYRDRIKEAIAQLSDVTVKGKKGNDALEKKLAPFNEELEYIESKIESKFPGTLISNGDEIGEISDDAEAEATEKSGDEESGDEDDEEDELFNAFSNPMKELERGYSAMEKKMAELEKAVAGKKMTSAQAEAEAKKLKAIYKEAKKVAKKKGATAQQVRDILEPPSPPSGEAVAEKEGDGNAVAAETKEEGDGWITPYAASQTTESRVAAAQGRYESEAKEISKSKNLTPGQKDKMMKRLDDKFAKHIKLLKSGKSEAEIESENKAAKKAIKDRIITENAGRPVFGSEHISKINGNERKNVVKMPKQLEETVRDNLLEPEWDGFEIDSDAKGNPLWVDGKFGFARNEETGVFAKINPDGSLTKLIDPENEKYRGPKAKETKQAYAAWQKAMRDFGKGTDEEKKAFEEFNYRRAGVPTYDEAPDNMTIVANAIMDAIAKAGI